MMMMIIYNYYIISYILCVLVNLISFNYQKFAERELHNILVITQI